MKYDGEIRFSVGGRHLRLRRHPLQPIVNYRPAPRGGVNLPAEAGQETVVRQLAELWGADCIRDSDGTQLSPELLELGFPVYSTVCLVRAEQTWPKLHPEQLPQKFLMSDPVTATDATTTIDPLAGFFKRKYKIDTNHDPRRYWQVFNRTTGVEVPLDDWSLDAAAGLVTIRNTTPFHLYTVNFLVYQIWDSTSMYNHLTNNWTCDPIVSVDPYYPETWDHLMEFYDRWIAAHPLTKVVRLTSLAYHFTLDSGPTGSDKYRDWLGYMDTISIPALDDFEREYGYRITSEDIVDGGYYNATYRVPSKKYRDWMTFIQKFVHRYGKTLCDKAHAAGKRTAMFFGDHWIGAEPYSDGYLNVGIDANIGACEDGVALRRCADTPGGNEKEVRFYPYFFPDVFHEGGNPTAESRQLWSRIRRAMLRKQVDRIGYGGYLSLAAKFPDFTAHVADICREFRTINELSGKTPCWKAPVKVGVLTCWGKLRSWLPMTGPSQKFRSGRADIMLIAGPNLLECLSGLPVDVRFFSFDDILAGGIPADLDVIINDGDADTSWSGGRYWADPDVVAAVRAFVHRGGGFIGSRDPSAHEHGGRFYQLSDIMGVQKETGQTLERLPVRFTVAKHFITDDDLGALEVGYDLSRVYCCDPRATVLAAHADGHVHLAANSFGGGRAVFMAGLPFNPANCRLLYRALLWAAGRESQLHRWFCDNVNVECAYYPQTGHAVAMNNSDQPQRTQLYDGAGNASQLELAAHEMKWFGGVGG
jgi:1,3-beta-galactosyl-N-acetylhexosamine phosphorylase